MSLQFTNELTFGTGSLTDGVTGTNGTGTSKVLYNSADSTGDTTLVTTSAIVNSVEYEMIIHAGYHDKVLAVITVDRLSTQFTFNSADGSAFQTVSSEGYGVLSPTAVRLWSLGYI